MGNKTIEDAQKDASSTTLVNLDSGSINVLSEPLNFSRLFSTSSHALFPEEMIDPAPPVSLASPSTERHAPPLALFDTPLKTDVAFTSTDLQELNDVSLMK